MKGQIEETPMIRDARQIARQLGIVDHLLAHQRLLGGSPAVAYEHVEAALILLGVTDTELLRNLVADSEGGDL